MTASSACDTPPGSRHNTSHGTALTEGNAMELGLANKHALITGSTAGIGYAIAKGLAAEGASVVITGRGQARVDDALKRLREAVPDAASLQR